DLLDSGGVWDVVEIAVWVGHVLVERRRQQAVVQREHGEDRLDSAGGAERVPGRALCGRDNRSRWERVGKDELEDTGLGSVTRWCGRAVRVDVTNVCRLE